MWTKSAMMVTAVQEGQDHRLKSPFLTKMDDLGMPRIQCSINGYNFQKTLCDTESGVNIMDAVTYQLLFGTMPLKPIYTMPLKPIYIQLQMADQTFRKIFRLLTWEKTSTIHPSSLGDRSSAPLKQSSTLEPKKSTCTSPLRRYAAILLTLTI